MEEFGGQKSGTIPETDLQPGRSPGAESSTGALPEADSQTKPPCPVDPIPATKSVSAEKIFAEMDAWFDEHIRNSAVAHATEAYNQLVASLANLKARLARIIE